MTQSQKHLTTIWNVRVIKFLQSFHRYFHLFHSYYCIIELIRRVTSIYISEDSYTVLTDGCLEIKLGDKSHVVSMLTSLFETGSNLVMQIVFDKMIFG